MKSEIPTTINVDEPIDLNKRDIPEASMDIRYRAPVCFNCRFWDRYNAIYGICQNPNVVEYWSNNEGQRPMFPDNFGCRYQESQGKGE